MKRSQRGRPRGLGGQAKTLNEEQVKRVIRMAKGRKRLSLRSEATLSLSLYLGLRAKEISALKWSDVYEADGQLREILRLKPAYTKGSKTRDVYLTAPRLRQVLKSFAAHSLGANSPSGPLLRSQKGGALRAGSTARFIKQLYADAGLPEASSHSGRRTFITSLAERGIDLKSIAILAGHSNIKTTALYVDASPVKLSRILSDVAW